MVTVTIPKEITRGEELVIIPRKLYESFLRVVKRKSLVSSPLNKGLKEALKEVKEDRLVGPFSQINEGLQALKSAK